MMQEGVTEMSRRSWVNKAFGTLAAIMLIAVPVLGLAMLNVDFSAQAPANETASATLFSFDAPTATVARYSPTEGEEVGEKVTPLVLSDWEYTKVIINYHRFGPPPKPPKPVPPKSPHK
jgi:hypothetical protein